MKRETRIGTNGRTVTILVPESPEDQAEIDRLAVAHEIDVAHSFGDQPEKRRRLARLRRLAERLRERRKGPGGA